jgi:hypothetical protein
MIYRILARSTSPVWDEARKVWSEEPGRLMGGFMAGLDGFDLKYPTITNRRARFYFTEAGWQKVGRLIVARARQRGVMLRVLQGKEPRKSQIVYADELQVAILPRKEHLSRSV